MGLGRATFLGIAGLVACGAPAAPERGPPEALEVSIAPASPRVGEHIRLAAQRIRSDGTTDDVTNEVEWRYDAQKWRTVSATELEAIAPGRTDVRAILGELEALLEVQIEAAGVVELEVTPGSVEIHAGETDSLTAMAIYADERTEDVTERVQWSVDDPQVVSVDAGSVTGDAVGRTDVTATLGDHVARATVEVLPATVTGLSVTSTRSAVEVGETVLLEARARYSDGAVEDVASEARWSVRPSSAARVNEGWLEAIGEGPVTIEARYADQTASLDLEIVPASIASLEITGNVAPGYVGNVRALRARAELRDGTHRDVTDDSTWTTDRPDVATVDEGVVRLVGVGAVRIAATLDGVTSAPVQIDVGPAVLVWLRIEGATTPLGTPVSLTATGIFSDGSERDVTQQVTWSSATPSVATVDTNGTVNPVAAGSTFVTAEDVASGISTRTTVTVTPAELNALTVVSSATTAFVGESLQLAVVGHFTDQDRDVTTEVALSCTPGLASIDASGVATAIAPGACVVDAYHPTHGIGTSGGTGSLSLAFVAVVPVALEIAPTPTLAPLATAPLQVTAHFNDGHSEDVTEATTWTVQDPTVATVGQLGNTFGRLTAQGAGTTAITATAVGLSTSAPITVANATLLSLDFTSTSTVVVVSAEGQLEVAGTFSNGAVHPITTSLTFNSDTPAVASVDSSVGRRGILLGVAEGFANATATAPNGMTTSALPVTSLSGVIEAEWFGPSPSFGPMASPAVAASIDVPPVLGDVAIVVTDVDVEVDFSFNDSTTCHPPWGFGVLTPYLWLWLDKAGTSVRLIDITDWDTLNFNGLFTVVFDQSAVISANFWVPHISPLHPSLDSLDDFNAMDPVGTWALRIHNVTAVQTCLGGARLVIRYRIAP